MLLREMSRDRAKEPRPLEAAPEPRSLPADRDLEAERLEDSLRRCLEQISAQNRDLILHYYQGDKSEKIRNRKALMERLRVPSGALRMRALRVRESLQLCAEHGLQQQRGIFW
jgi:DNA-directed RNA polymerase specialized sigma24 family protein